MAYNDDELVAPAWLNDEFFRDVLREANNDPTIQLTSECVLRPGTKKGDHYASIMFRTTVKYRSTKSDGEQSINLIMKTIPEAEGLKKEMLQDNTLFDIEIRMYSRILPEIARLLKEIGEEYKFPKYIYGALKPHTVFILEDISNQGWVMSDFVKTFDDMKPVVRNIAMYHAASVMMESNGGKLSVEFKYTLDDMMKNFEPMIKKGFGDLLYLADTCPDFAHFAKPLQNFQAAIPNTFGSWYKSSETFQNVLIHGDFHSKNMLHQIDAEGRHTDTILLDYQICCWTSPAIDLYYLLDMIPTQEVKDNHRHELIYLYYQQYADLLKRLGFLGKIPTMLELQMELLRCAGLEMFHYAVFTSFRYMDPSKLDIEQLLLGKMSNPALENPEFRRVMLAELSRFLHQGTLSTV